MITDGECLQYSIQDIEDITINELIDKGKRFTLIDPDKDTEVFDDDDLY